MGNALACRLALQSIALFEEQDYLAKIRRMEQITRRELAGFSHPSIREIRIMGGCVCIEVFDPAVLWRCQQFAYERGVFSRPFLQYLYAMVPYIIEEEELVTVLRTMKARLLRIKRDQRRLFRWGNGRRCFFLAEGDLITVRVEKRW